MQLALRDALMLCSLAVFLLAAAIKKFLSVVVWDRS